MGVAILWDLSLADETLLQVVIEVLLVSKVILNKYEWDFPCPRDYLQGCQYF